MTSLDPAATAAPVRPLVQRLVPVLYGVTLFASALLLFVVQPMFAKMVLPLLGGAPSVWSVAMVLFRPRYSPATVTRISLAARFRQVARHLFISLCSVAPRLPCRLASLGGFDIPPSANVGIWLIGLFTVSIGLPLWRSQRPRPCCKNGLRQAAITTLAIRTCFTPRQTSARLQRWSPIHS